MDTSHTYRHMVVMPPEIAENHVWEGWDYLYIPGYGMYSYDFYKKSIQGGGKIIWLPRQDQLQRLLEDATTYETIAMLYIGFYNYCRDIEPFDFTSMEQVWLAYVMFEKYGKEWNGKDWIGD